MSDDAPKRVDVGGGERGDAAEQGAADVATEAIAARGTEVDRDDREHDLDERDAEHDAARACQM